MNIKAAVLFGLFFGIALLYLAANSHITVVGVFAVYAAAGLWAFFALPDQAELKRLRWFKAYVHKRLDAMGIAAKPETLMRANGCRVGARLDLVELVVCPANHIGNPCHKCGIPTEIQADGYLCPRCKIFKPFPTTTAGANEVSEIEA